MSPRALLLSFLLAAGAWAAPDPATWTLGGTTLRVDDGLAVARGPHAGRAVRTAGGWLDVAFDPPTGLAQEVEGVAAPLPPGWPLSGLYLPLPDGRVLGWLVTSGGRRDHEEGGRAGAPAASAATGFRRHVQEAIDLNRARRAGYVAVAGDAAARTSRRLVVLERCTLLWARWVDWRARRFVRQGVPIIAADFVPMSIAPRADRPPARRGQASEAQWAELEALLGAFKREVNAALDANAFETIAARAHALLREVEAREAAWGCHLAMTRHTVEQVGWAALNAVTWSRRSGGETDALARSFIRSLRLGVTAAPPLDLRAQAAHARGAGIIVNDVPEIPFERAWAAWERGRGR